MPLDNVVRQRCLQVWLLHSVDRSGPRLTALLCSQTLQSLVQGCSINVRPNISPIVSTCLSTLVYDPNYEYSADAKMDADDSGEDDSDDYDDYDSSDLDDDEDDSWKVHSMACVLRFGSRPLDHTLCVQTRRASANCLMAVITTRPDLTSTLYDQCAGILITQFRVRHVINTAPCG